MKQFLITTATKVRDVVVRLLVQASIDVRGSVALRKLRRGSEDVACTQERLRKRLLDAYGRTELGKHFGLHAGSTLEEFKQQVPLLDYELLRPWIEKQMNSKEAILSPEPPIAYNVTSGTTGCPKYIPVCKQTLAWTRDAQMITASRLRRCRQKVFRGKILAITSPAIERYTSFGVPVGSKSGQVYENVNALIRSKYIVPSKVLGVEDSALKYLVILRLALAHEDITYIQTANTSTFTVLSELLNKNWQELLRSLAEGGFHRWDELTPDVQAVLLPRLHAKPARARYLQEVFEERSKQSNVSQRKIRLGDIFPQLESVGCWKSGSAGIFLKRLTAEFSQDVLIRDVGYIASECHGTTPLDGDGLAAIPTFDQVYFEFVPREQWDTGSRDASNTLGLHQLELGRQYYVIVTTSDGLLRYDMNDILEVVGFWGSTPRLHFVQKGSGVTNITGEKVSEYQVVRAVDRFEAQYRLRSTFFFMVADERRGAYRLYYQPSEEHRFAVEHFLHAYSQEIDQHLCALNREYADKRKSGRLKPLSVAILQSGTFQSFRNDWVSRGRREAQFKIVAVAHRWELEFDFESFVTSSTQEVSAEAELISSLNLRSQALR